MKGRGERERVGGRETETEKEGEQEGTLCQNLQGLGIGPLHLKLAKAPSYFTVAKKRHM